MFKPRPGFPTMVFSMINDLMWEVGVLVLLILVESLTITV